MLMTFPRMCFWPVWPILPSHTEYTEACSLQVLCIRILEMDPLWNIIICCVDLVLCAALSSSGTQLGCELHGSSTHRTHCLKIQAWTWQQMPMLDSTKASFALSLQDKCVLQLVQLSQTACSRTCTRNCTQHAMVLLAPLLAPQFPPLAVTYAKFLKDLSR